MKVKAETTVGELMARFPNGFAVGPGSPENPGALQRVICATSHFRVIASQFAILDGNKGYMVVDLDEEADEGNS